jgi:hypothetical protein
MTVNIPGPKYSVSSAYAGREASREEPPKPAHSFYCLLVVFCAGRGLGSIRPEPITQPGYDLWLSSLLVALDRSACQMTQ